MCNLYSTVSKLGVLYFADWFGKLSLISCTCSTVIFSFFLQTGAKEEILANLANFAYDPINYDHFRKLNVADLFLGKDNNIIC